MSERQHKANIVPERKTVDFDQAVFCEGDYGVALSSTCKSEP
jgi:hypothetical protein